MTPTDLNNAEKIELEAYQSLSRYAHDALGSKEWRHLQYYGKVMDGTRNGGLYVSALRSHEAKVIVDDLLKGKVVKVHLMHRHRSGCYEASSLCLRDGRLIMLFEDRCEFALGFAPM